MKVPPFLLRLSTLQIALGVSIALHALLLTVRFIDPAHPNRGLVFDGRTAEDFKLSTGTFVSVGPLRARVTLAGAPSCRTSSSPG